MKTHHAIPLNNAALRVIKSKVKVPNYVRSSTEPRILHIGVGGFHRAHLAYFTHKLLQSGQYNWSIHGAGIMEHDQKMANVLQPQDCLYTLITRGPKTEEIEIIGSITDYIYAYSDRERFCRHAAEGDYEIISLTITEKGYHFAGDQRKLDLKHPAIAHDIAHPTNPMSAVGIIFRIAQIRLAIGKALPTFLSCDNVPHNGSTLRSLILEYGDIVDPSSSSRLKQQGCFPNSMVDRITPATTTAEISYVSDTLKLNDGWPVVCEDFIQWFVEDSFALGRPPWELAGAMMVPDVTPYETMKIRLLNGAHSALAYISYLLGYRYVDDATKDSDIRRFIARYMKEVEPSVGTVPGINLSEYQQKIIERFSNRAIRDQVLRLAEDGSSKIPNMILAGVSEVAPSGNSCSISAFAIAAWIRFLQGVDFDGEKIPIKDPLSEILAAKAVDCTDSIKPFLSLKAIFSERILRQQNFLSEIERLFNELNTYGPRKALSRLIRSNR